MKLIYLLPVTGLIVLNACRMEKKGSQGKNSGAQADRVAAQIVDDSRQLAFFDGERTPLEPMFTALPTGSNKPAGWLYDLMKNDLQDGMVGALGDLYPGIRSDDLYRTARRGGLEDVPEMGDLELTGATWEQAIMWWNAETSGNWWDGFVRHAFLTGDGEAIGRSRAIVDNLLASQDDDGYIGIYKENLRYRHEGANGELWSQTTAFRMLLAFYEFTGEQRVLDAVERAMALTMRQYGPDGTNPFRLKNEYGGATHGLMMTDVCETLFRITGRQEYRDYATWLYRAYSTYSVNRAFNDVRYPFLLQKDSLFEGHAVHAYEHLRSLIAAYYNTGRPEMKTAFENAMYKLDRCLMPGGEGFGNEWLVGEQADPEHSTTEFCAMLELRNFYGSAVQKTGEVAYADHAEKMTFNAMMGSRNRNGTALAYGKGDNCFVLDGKEHGPDGAIDDPRFKYSPVHSKPAVCCVPNYGRNYPYYLDRMWMRAADGFAAVMYGPATLTAEVGGVQVSVEQVTNYPFSDRILFRMHTERPERFALYFRKPGWSDRMVVTAEGTGSSYEDGYYRVEKAWADGDEVTLTFQNKTQVRKLSNGEVYFQRGPLVYALAIPDREEAFRNYDREGFADYYCFPEDPSMKEWSATEAARGEIEFRNPELPPGEDPWYRSEPCLEVALTDPGGNTVSVRLVPMGNTVLRKVTFRVR